MGRYDGLINWLVSKGFEFDDVIKNTDGGNKNYGDALNTLLSVQDLSADKIRQLKSNALKEGLTEDYISPIIEKSNEEYIEEMKPKIDSAGNFTQLKAMEIDKEYLATTVENVESIKEGKKEEITEKLTEAKRIAFEERLALREVSFKEFDRATEILGRFPKSKDIEELRERGQL